MAIKLPIIVPVLPTADLQRDLEWYSAKTGFKPLFVHDMYAGIRRGDLTIHLQWHADTEDDPLLGGSVIKIFVDDVQSIFDEFVALGTVPQDKLRRNTPWNTHEFGFYDLNKNAIFFVQGAD
ncbi:VOC family protein [Aquimarina sp. 2201CG5-10]|uniref:VOC family protein n=1 Tax=Aquimarina callyspongiae TaxID=3098150 RepID=UPI002AB4934B|nr:VOC family protein [Aquimarina sp. 2201CG5-10]MDY8137437.1 glyoxalase/bleomycin resistance/extradiol dioxygenase family protein [Aquimarina sp. 2201CG5-10]